MIALRDYAAWITGVQIGVDYSRIDFSGRASRLRFAVKWKTR
jgi:Ser-tRNA(Ala) deacylase AlaX